MKRTILLLITIILTSTLLFSCAAPQPPQTALAAAELLDLGERFLLDLEFEQALVQFLRVIEIEPMNPRGYTGAAEAHIGLGNTARAREVLEQGLEQIPGNHTLGDMLEELDEALRQQEREEQERLEAEERERQRELLGAETIQILDELDFTDPDAICEKLQTSELADMIAELAPYLDFPVFIDTANGRMGIYQTDVGLMIYQGSFVDDIREGFGTWFSLDGHYFAEGEWRDDAPNGQFIKRWSGTHYTGNVVNGMWHGEVFFAFSSDHGHHFQLDMGSIIIIRRQAGNGSHPYIVGECDYEGCLGVVMSTEREIESWFRGIRGFTNEAL